jgi:hypothetical protein
VTSTNAKNVIELRRLLVERFPGVRMVAGRPDTLVKRWPTGIPSVDFQLEGGFAKSALTEIISSGVRCGSSLLVAEMVRRVHQNGEWAALIDSRDSFDPGSLHNEELARLLWVRCSSAKEAIKAADLILHDGTIPVVVVDLIGCARKQLRRIPSSTWHRLSHTVESAATVCVILTSEVMISTAEARLELQPRFTIDSLEIDQPTLLEQIMANPPAKEQRTSQKRFGVVG